MICLSNSVHIEDGNYDVFIMRIKHLYLICDIFLNLSLNRCLSFTYNVGIYFKHKHDPQIDFELDKISE